MDFFSRRTAARPVVVPAHAGAAPLSAAEQLERNFHEHYEALYRFLRCSWASDSAAEDVGQEANHGNYFFASFNSYDRLTGRISASIPKTFPILPSVGVAVEW